MNEYTASNATVVEEIAEDELFLSNEELAQDVELDAWMVTALREFFRAEEDERLGRWRWPENPDYVVYPQGLDHDGFRYAMAVYEPTGNAGKWQEGQSVSPPMTDPQHLGIYAVAAYFDAHPEPKPAWHDAKSGEVWAIKFGVSEDEEIVQAKDSFFVNLSVSDRWFDTTGKKAPDITDARRIWPES